MLVSLNESYITVFATNFFTATMFHLVNYKIWARYKNGCARPESRTSTSYEKRELAVDEWVSWISASPTVRLSQKETSSLCGCRKRTV